jgi:PIN domain nuclease of toxin-antitoxin system
MNIILDTHIFLWILAEPERINQKYLEYLENSANEIYISSISIAEIAIKSSIGKLNFNFEIDEVISISGFESLDFTINDAIELTRLPFHHKDPFDRMIISQAVSRNFYIITDDEKFKSYVY